MEWNGTGCEVRITLKYSIKHTSGDAFRAVQLKIIIVHRRRKRRRRRFRASASTFRLTDFASPYRCETCSKYDILYA
jgi:hypothetical protein